MKLFLKRRSTRDAEENGDLNQEDFFFPRFFINFACVDIHY